MFSSGPKSRNLTGVCTDEIRLPLDDFHRLAVQLHAFARGCLHDESVQLHGSCHPWAKPKGHLC